MEKFDIIIVGAGPAGLKAAEILAKNKKKVLVLEKNKIIGPKVCAAGITEKDIEHIPKELIEREFQTAIFKNHKKKIRIKLKEKLYTIERKTLGQYQAKEAKKAGAIIKTNSFVKKIKNNSVTTNNKEYSFDYLIGADGSTSTVRTHLKLKTKLTALAVQYKIKKVVGDIELHFNTKKFNAWYAWIFPHKNYTYIGTGTLLTPKQKENIRTTLDNFAKQQNLTTKDQEFEAAMINVDYKGHIFNNIFLIGDAAALANPFTGEGIYQAIISGEAIANKILNPHNENKKLNKIIKKNIKLIKIILFLNKHPIILNLTYNLGFKLMKFKPFQNKLLKILLDY
tara:strand:- start:93 stop:1109 length:1017 start_codon:yes stop_codon:yes gene_type:complete